MKVVRAGGLSADFRHVFAARPAASTRRIEPSIAASVMAREARELSSIGKFSRKAHQNAFSCG
ncbi:MAG: hypothetical protein ACREDY_22090 [Bradyrhizobium sp.]